jgi:ketosteroid isomerase-like protein
MKNLLLCFLVSASLIACTNQETKTEENVTIASDNVKPDLVSIKAEIQALETFYDSASNAGDFKTLMTIYSDDVIGLGNNKMRTQGKANVQKEMESSFEAGKISHSKTTEVFGDGDVITEIGEFSNTDIKGKTSTGKYICVWKKQNEKYLIIAEIMNLDVKPN